MFQMQSKESWIIKIGEYGKHFLKVKNNKQTYLIINFQVLAWNAWSILEITEQISNKEWITAKKDNRTFKTSKYHGGEFLP